MRVPSYEPISDVYYSYWLVNINWGEWHLLSANLISCGFISIFSCKLTFNRKFTLKIAWKFIGIHLYNNFCMKKFTKKIVKILCIYGHQVSLQPVVLKHVFVSTQWRNSLELLDKILNVFLILVKWGWIGSSNFFIKFCPNVIKISEIDPCR